MEKQNIQAKEVYWSLPIQIICNTDNSCCHSSRLRSFPVALTSNEIPFLSFGTLLQSSGSVAFPFQLLPLSSNTTFQEIFFDFFAVPRVAASLFRAFSPSFPGSFSGSCKCYIVTFSAFTFTNLLFTNCVTFRGQIAL